MTKTTTPKKQDVKQSWHLIDADGKILGKIATDIAKLLIGKHKAIYTQNINVGDKVVVINTRNIAVTGDKMVTKIYKRYTGYPGGIKQATLSEVMQKDATSALRRAVKGMLPQNKLTKERMRNLYIYTGAEHPHTAQLSK